MHAETKGWRLHEYQSIVARVQQRLTVSALSEQVSLVVSLLRRVEGVLKPPQMQAWGWQQLVGWKQCVELVSPAAHSLHRELV